MTLLQIIANGALAEAARLKSENERLRAEILDWKRLALAMRDEAIVWDRDGISACDKIQDMYFNAAMFGRFSVDEQNALPADDPKGG